MSIIKRVTKLSDDKINSQNFLELLDKLKNKFNDSNTQRCEKIQILTLLPESWGLSRVCELMGCTIYMASIAKSLRDKKRNSFNSKCQIRSTSIE
ncbi:hypothetical protein KQX54_014461 [Cotesia glomerata]|uniref:Uncharacterized protein n=1 Tax=Cotesia glomerata TaxID=32391 RepID=A0AAV7I2F5_COTGL|nr:hypothetical protein KQX54_014461 [Cotesia glomerata]